MSALEEYAREISLGQDRGRPVLTFHDGPRAYGSIESDSKEWLEGLAEVYAEWRRKTEAQARLPLADYGRVYTRRGSRAHLAAPFGRTGSDHVLCKVLPQWPDEWLGTGSQKERDRAAALPLCRRCESLFGASLTAGAI